MQRIWTRYRAAGARKVFQSRYITCRGNSVKVMMEWSNEVTFEFLDLYEREAVIWDPSHAQHKNRNDVYDAWKRIQTEFSAQISITDLKKKKDSLMATFRNCLNKVKQSEKSGAGTDDLYKPAWFAFSRMAKFLSHHTPRNTINSQNIDLESNNESQLETQSDDISNVAVRSAEPSTYSMKRRVPLDRSTTKMTKVTQEVIYDKMEKAYDILQKKSQQKDKDE
ncbi:hypothetical protein PPYR_04878 [Photinus pyralis]|uniref:MADF domain-containing protein n=1 Tax=Photinus pyralis TaxID=7054 RepID=A0A5N4AZB0_PHOPY|nr:hypothetical protein PPYR_04878 [Photinus pyralis]